MKEIFNHSKCCLSKMDRPRHELDRGIQAKERELSRKEPRERKLDEINRHIARFGSELREEEERSFRQWAQAS